ncbi:MAG TPA: hypothetical protein VHQ21_07040 [Rhodanobacteraceae bacterium]|nr:hypothetical protein [Rhodanobacteraceae bacterium]
MNAFSDPERRFRGQFEASLQYLGSISYFATLTAAPSAAMLETSCRVCLPAHAPVLQKGVPQAKSSGSGIWK